MANNLNVKDKDAVAQVLGAREYNGVKYPQIVDWLRARIQSAASTNATLVKASAATLNSIHVFNGNAAVRYLKLYNLAVPPTVGTSTPVWTIPIPIGGWREINIPGGMAFSVGISYAITSGVADNDTGAVSANDVSGALSYL